MKDIDENLFKYLIIAAMKNNPMPLKFDKTFLKYGAEVYDDLGIEIQDDGETITITGGQK